MEDRVYRPIQSNSLRICPLLVHKLKSCFLYDGCRHLHVPRPYFPPAPLPHFGSALGPLSFADSTPFFVPHRLGRGCTFSLYRNIMKSCFRNLICGRRMVPVTAARSRVRSLHVRDSWVLLADPRIGALGEVHGGCRARMCRRCGASCGIGAVPFQGILRRRTAATVRRE